ncbi:MAG: serine/threonine-protein kinase [Nannocystaceae bacterium]|nr:serine/threonine-protein kinase [Nannocystaceae bacterium]
MPCLSANEVVALASGHLGGDSRDRAFDHLGECDTCRALVAAATADDDAPQFARGDAIGRYLVLEPLGAGAMGVVLEAYDPELDRRVAIKLLRTDPAVGEAASDGVRQLQAEARALARLSHPHVVAVHDVGRFGDEVFIAMELVRGPTLAAWLRAATRPLPAVLEVLLAAGDGLAAAHAAGVIHRDFKPDNVIVADDGRARVTDFGLARAAPGDALALADAPTLALAATRTGAIAGTPAYMAPELFAGEAADEATDVWSFCVTAFEALAGRRPWQARDLAALRQQIARGVTWRDGEVPPRVREAVLRGLDVDRQRRWPAMAPLLAALRPPRPRARALPIAVVVALATVGAAAVAAIGQQPPCTAGAATIAPMWDASQRAAVQAAFEASGAGPGALAPVDDALTSWASAWAHAHDEACEATRVRGIQSEAVLDARGRCLERARGRTEAFVRLLRGADAHVVQRAGGLVSQLPRLEPCSDLDALARAAPEPVLDDDALAQRRALETRAFDAAARVAADLPTGDEFAQVVHDAEDAGHLDLAARFAVHAAYCQPTIARTRDLLARATGHALAVGDDETLVRAWTHVVDIEGRQRRLDVAELAAAQALAALSRLGNPDALAGVLEHKRCIGYEYAGRLDDALEHCERAVELLSRVTWSSPELADAQQGVGLVLYERGEPERALVAIDAALELYREHVSEDHSLVANARSNRAEVLLLLGRTEEALAILREMSIRFPRWTNFRDGIATALRMQGDFAAAFREDLGLLAVCEAAVSCEFWVFLGVGDDLLGLGNPIAASVWFERARQLGGDQPPADRARALLGLAEAARDPQRTRALAAEALALLDPWALQFGVRYAALLQRARRLAAT